MTDTGALYRLFGLSLTCNDDELRQGYHRALFESHPDRNPRQLELATTRTQQLVAAYKELKLHRSSRLSSSEKPDNSHGFSTTVNGYTFSVYFSFESTIDLEDIAHRKTEFREAWAAARKNPCDLDCALHLVHAASRAEQLDSVENLLLNPLLIDSASFLLSLEEPEDACNTLLAWATILQRNQHAIEAVQILEDAHATGQASPEVDDELQHIYYSWAQRFDPTTGTKATPEVRAKLLDRILDLGFEYDYIHKLVAEAYHELGDDEQARAHLRKAYELNPELSGAVRITRELGFSQAARPSQRKARAPTKKYTRPEQIPSPIQIREWAQSGNWNTIMCYADPNDYSQGILSKARDTLRQIAVSLEKCDDATAIEALTKLLLFDYHADVTRTAMTALSKIGDRKALDIMEKFQPRFERAYLETCISYLRARITSQSQTAASQELSTEEWYTRIKSDFDKGDFGHARYLLHILLASTETIRSLSHESAIALARLCGQREMGEWGAAVRLMKLIYPNLSSTLRREISLDMATWLWNSLLAQEYTSANDEDYQLGLDIHIEFVLESDSPGVVLRNLHSLTRWLELVGARDTIQWIRQLLRSEAPGTWYVDKHGREQYIRNIDPSQAMRQYLIAFDEKVKTKATAKLKQMMKGAHTLEDATWLLDDR